MIKNPELLYAIRRTDGEPIGDFDWIDTNAGDWSCVDEGSDAMFEPVEYEMVEMTVRPIATRRIGVHLFEPCGDDPKECDICSGDAGSIFHLMRAEEGGW